MHTLLYTTVYYSILLQSMYSLVTPEPKKATIKQAHGVGHDSARGLNDDEWWSRWSITINTYNVILYCTPIFPSLGIRMLYSPEQTHEHFIPSWLPCLLPVNQAPDPARNRKLQWVDRRPRRDYSWGLRETHLRWLGIVYRVQSTLYTWILYTLNIWLVLIRSCLL